MHSMCLGARIANNIMISAVEPSEGSGLFGSSMLVASCIY